MKEVCMQCYEKTIHKCSLCLRHVCLDCSEKESDLFEMADKYVRHINFFKSDNDVGHSNFILLNQY